VSTIEMIETADEVVEAEQGGTALISLEAMEKIAAGLALLSAESRDFDVTTTVGEKAARQYRAKCVKLRTSLDKAYETVNRPMLDAQAKARKLLKDITASVKELEEPVDALIVAEETRKAAEKARREQIERERVAAHQVAIEDIHMVAHAAVGKTSAQIRAILADVKAIDADSGFEEFRPLAVRAKIDTVGKLDALLTAAVAQEAEAARLAAERQELARQRAEQEAREKAERERIAAEQKVEAERLSVERAELEAMRAENQRMAAALAESQRKEAEAAATRQAEENARAAAAAVAAAAAAARAAEETEAAAKVAEAERLQKASQPEPAPVVAEVPAAEMAPAPLPSPAAVASEVAPVQPATVIATINAGTIGQRMGFPLPAAFIETILEVPRFDTRGTAVLWREADFARIKTALIAHLECVK
jgi:IgA-specific serine endopeptidase